MKYKVRERGNKRRLGTLLKLEDAALNAINPGGSLPV